MCSLSTAWRAVIPNDPRGISGKLCKFAVRILLFLGAYLSYVIAKCDIFPTALIESGVCLSNNGHIICGARVIGAGTLIHDHVTIGMNLFDSGTPEIGRNVWIGPWSIIYGNIKVGDGVTILPNTVLTKSVPDGVIGSGSPCLLSWLDYVLLVFQPSSYETIRWWLVIRRTPRL